MNILKLFKKNIVDLKKYFSTDWSPKNLKKNHILLFLKIIFEKSNLLILKTDTLVLNIEEKLNKLGFENQVSLTEAYSLAYFDLAK